MMQGKIKALLATAAVALALSSNPVFADTVTYTGAGVSPAGVGMTINGGGLGGPLSTTAGQIVLSGVKIDGVNAPNIGAWCVDIFHTLAGGGTFSTSTAMAPALLVTIEKLINGGTTYNGGLSVANNNAATQLAIWRAVFSPPTVTSSDGTVSALADTYLGYATAGTNGFVDLANKHVELLDPVPTGSTQKLAFLRDGPPPATDTPEPASLALISVGLIGLGAARRKLRRS